MKKSNWTDVAELVGIAAIVASLVFVGLQMRQSQEIAIAEQYQARAVIAIENWARRSENEFTVRSIGSRELSSHGRPPHMSEDASLEEIGSEFLDGIITFLTYDNLHFQYESGFLTDEAWDSHTRGMKANLRDPRLQHYLYEHKHVFRKSYWEWCDRLVRDP